MRAETVVNLPSPPDFHAPGIPAQLADWLRGLVAAGRLKPGDHLPSTRALALRLKVSRGSVVACYEQLAAEGYVQAAQGAGTQIDPDLPELPKQEQPVRTKQPPRPSITHLRPGAPDATALATPTWRAAWREAVASGVKDLPPLGSWELRVQIAEHLRHMRGVTATPEHILITSGAREGLGAVLLALEPTDIAVETPGFPSLRKVPGYFGHTVVPAATDEHGIIPRHLPNAGAALVTPSHQYPYGGSLSATRRHELVHWARTQGAWLIEDDHDSELRYVGQPLPALHALDAERTILLGTFSALLSPALAVGYVVLPHALVDQVTRQRTELGQPVGAVPQLALAHYLASGALRRHTQRRRTAYRRRLALVQKAFQGREGIELMPIQGGLHAVLLCERPSAHVVAECAQQGFGVTDLQTYWGAGAGEEKGRNGVVFGFGACDDATLARALGVIAAAASGK